MIKRIEKYSAEWCGPCKVLAKTMKEVLSNYPEIEFIEYDADEDEEKFDEKQIKNVPQLFFYNENNEQVHHLTGNFPSNKIKDIIDYHNRDLDKYNPYNKEYIK